MSNMQIISKGLYKNNAEKSFPVELKEYIFARTNDKKCLFLRFFNGLEFNVTGIHFWLIQKNSYGELIQKKKIELTDISAEAGEFFAPEDCFFVDEECVDFDIKIASVFVGVYEYRAENGEVFVRASIDYYPKRAIRKKVFCNQRKKLNGGVKYSILILFMALLLVAFAFIIPFFIKEVYPVIKRALEIAWDFMGDVIESFIRKMEMIFESKKT